MDSALSEGAKSEAAVAPAVEVAVAGEKRPVAEEDGGGGGVVRKRLKNGGGGEVEMRRIAEIVMVLSAMGTMRGGREPTAAEKEMMVEARAKLVSICEELAPRDIMPREVFGGIIEDLGLNRLKEQRLGFRPSKLSIVEKMEISKRRMGESKSFAAQAAVDSTQRQTGAVANEKVGMATANRPFTSDRTGHMPVSAGSFQHALPLGHASSTSSTILSFQTSSNQVTEPSIATGLPNNNLGRGFSSATGRVESPHLRSGNGPSQAPQLPAGFVVRTTAALQPQSITSSNAGAKNKLPYQPPTKIEGTANLHTQQLNPQPASVKQASDSVMTQMASGSLLNMPPIQGVRFVHPAPLVNNHLEVSEIVQKMLHPKPAESAAWNPPSKDYMNRSVACQMCKSPIIEVDNMLVCDACEKGFHLKCLQSCNQKFVPRGEWYCPRCMTISGGKPFPPKYGRVTRNMASMKVTSNSAGVQSPPPEKKVEAHHQKQQKIVTDGKPDESNAPHGPESFKSKNVQRTDRNGNELTGAIKREVFSSETCPDRKQFSAGPSFVSSSALSSENRPTQDVVKPKAEAEAHVPDVPPGFRRSERVHLSNSHSGNGGTEASNGISALPQLSNDNNHLDNHSENVDRRKADGIDPTCDLKQDDPGIGQRKLIGVAGASSELQDSAKVSGGIRDVDWIGDTHEVVANKKFYQSCRINGVVYKSQHYVLARSGNGMLMPWKLQAMWEDTQNGSRWVAVNRCYFPSDLPVEVGRPSAPEGNEVYESNDESTLMAGLIEGPCDVLQGMQFGEINKKGDQESGARPIFSCRWFYDKYKGVFCPVPR